MGHSRAATAAGVALASAFCGDYGGYDRQDVLHPMIKLTNESGGLLFGPFADRQDAGRPPAVLPYALGIYWLMGDDSGCGIVACHRGGRSCSSRLGHLFSSLIPVPAQSFAFSPISRNLRPRFGIDTQDDGDRPEISMEANLRPAATIVDAQATVSWPAIAAGAVAAAALALVLVAFGAGLGLSAISPWSDSGVSASTFKSAPEFI